MRSIGSNFHASNFQRWAARPSNWLAVVIGLGLTLAVAKISQSTTVPKVIIGTKDEVFYARHATERDALELGRALKEIGYFTDRGAGVLLEKSGGGPIVSFVLSDGAWLRPNTISEFGEIARHIAPTVGGFPLKVRLVDEKMAVRRNLAVGKETVGMRDTIYYYGAATSEEAGALGQSLRSAGVLHDTGTTVVLEKGDVTTISFVVRQTAWERPEIVAAFETVARQAAPSVGGLPVLVRFLDSGGGVHREVSIE